MFAGKTNVLPRIRNYGDAKKYFNETPRPRSVRKWDDNERPLKDTRSWHYRIVENHGGVSYSVCLYTTEMARFYRPDELGVTRRCYIGHHSQTSKRFMWDVLGVQQFNTLRDAHGVTVVMPIYDQRMHNADFSLDAYFDPYGALIRERSEHTLHFRRLSGREDKAARARARELLDPLFTMAVMRMPAFAVQVQDCSDWQLNNYITPFSSGPDITYVQRNEVRRLVHLLEHGQAPTAAQVDAFMHVAYSVFAQHYAKAADQEGLFPRVLRHNMVSAIDHRLMPEISPEKFTAALWRKVSELCKLNYRSDLKPYPQFPEPDQIVCSNVVTRP